MSTGTTPEEMIEGFVRKAMAGSDEMPLCEFMSFSGSADDWRKDGNHVLLRLTGRNTDDAGQSYEVWARLVAPGGLWKIPTAPTEMLVLCPPQLWRTAGAAWAIHGAQLPPGKVDQETAYLPFGDDTTLLLKGGGFALKCGETMIAIDRATGLAQIAVAATGTHIALDPATNAIELTVSDGSGATRALLRLGEDGIGLAVASADGTKKQVWKLDADSGDCVAAGTGAFMAMYGSVGLGKNPVQPISLGQPPVPSTSCTYSP